MKMMNGVVIGTVTAIKEGEVKIKFPWLHENEGEEKESNWVRIATAMAGKNKGTFFMPDIDDEVLVAFEQGDFNHPYIIGFLWNGKDKTPETDIKKSVIRTKSGHKIELHDNPGAEKIVIKSQGDQSIEIEDFPGGKITLKTKMGNSITIDETLGEIHLEALKTISMKAPDISMDAANISLNAAAALTLNSPAFSLGSQGDMSMNIPSLDLRLVTGTVTVNESMTIQVPNPSPPRPGDYNLLTIKP